MYIYMLKLATAHPSMPILRRKHQCREGILVQLLQIRLRLDQCAGDLLKMVQRAGVNM